MERVPGRALRQGKAEAAALRPFRYTRRVRHHHTRHKLLYLIEREKILSQSTPSRFQVLTSPKVAKADLFRAEGVPVGPALLKPVVCQGPRGRQHDRALSARITFMSCGPLILPAHPGRIYDRNRLSPQLETGRPCTRAGSIYDRGGPLKLSLGHDTRSHYLFSDFTSSVPRPFGACAISGHRGS
jgi:hypothetical protein